MRLISLLFTCLIATIHLFAQTNPAVDDIIKREMQERKIPGLQVAVVSKGKIVLNKSYGIANVQDSVSVSNQSIFAINSCTKVFTAVAIMQLVEQGKIDLSKTVATYLDDLPATWSTVTIKQLLTHTSGLPDGLGLLDERTGGTGNTTETTFWEKLKVMPFISTPGERFNYNQTNAYLLAKLINKFSSKTFQEVFDERQFQPAGLKHTVFDQFP